MSHQLLIEFNIIPFENTYADILEANEIPRGKNAHITFKIKNIGLSTFNGTVEEIGIFYKGSTEHQSIIGETPINITDLPAKYINEKRKLFDRVIVLQEEGAAYIILRIRPFNTGEEIEYFSNNGIEDISLGIESWTQVIRVINREHLEMIKLLKELNNKIG